MSDFPQSQNDMLIAKVDELQRQILAQRAEMRVLTESVTKLTAFVKQSMKSKRQRLGDTAVDDDFPISSDAELAEIDAKICKETRGNYIHYMKKILGQGRVSLTIKSIFSEEIIMAYNNDGTGNKKKLKDYENLFNALLDAIGQVVPSVASEKVLSKAMRCVKNNAAQKKKNIKTEEDSLVVNF